MVARTIRWYGDFQNAELVRSCLGDCGCEDLTTARCRDCVLNDCALDSSSTYLKCLDDCAASHTFVAILFGFMGALQVSCFILARLVVYGRTDV